MVPVLQEMFVAESEDIVAESVLVTRASPAAAAEGHSSIERDIVNTFGSFDLGVEAVGTIKGPQVTRVRAEASIGSQSCIAGEPRRRPAGGTCPRSATIDQSWQGVRRRRCAATGPEGIAIT